MNISARMTVQTVTRNLGSDQVKLIPVYSSDPSSPNYSFSQATPSGSLELSITNPAVIGRLVPGDTFDVTLTPYIAPVQS